jgi:hypothetical protein
VDNIHQAVKAIGGWSKFFGICFYLHPINRITMKNTPPSKIEKILDIDFSEENEIWLTGQKAMRKLIGILGMLLPVILYLFLLIDAGKTNPLDSISHYYMTRACSVFVIVVSLLAIFLLIYKGKELPDFLLSAGAGLFALCLIIFPTNDILNEKDIAVAVTNLNDSAFRSSFHYISAGIFLLCLAAMSIFIFTISDKTPEKRTPRKRMRNRLYRTCGIIMILAILVILANFIGIIPDKPFQEYDLTFWMETIAIESFGLSWLVKGEMFLKDKKKPAP